jgi:Xaa-Pro aminopeptidase
MELSNINSREDIEELLLTCRDKRYEQICKKIENKEEVFIKAITITNDFQKPVVDPYFFYISMLPMDIIPTDSILSFQIINNKLVVKIYSNNNDNETGIKLNLDLLKKMGITHYKLYILPEKIVFLNSLLKEKLNKLRLKKDDWEFLQIYDCINKTYDIFKKMTNHIKSNEITSEQYLESIYYKYLIKDEYRVPYLPIIGSSQNAAYIHYLNNNSPIMKGQVVLMDCGVKNKYGYASDITRTIINDKCELHKKVYNIVKKAHDSCVELIRKYLMINQNISLNDLDEQCIQVYIEEFANFEIDTRYPQWSNGIQNCKKKSFLEGKQFIKNFYTHFIGHNIGLDTHDPNGDGYLEERCIFTIEPGLYFNKNTIGFEIPAELYEIGGIRIEDMYTILKISGALQIIHLSDNIPKI